MKVLIPGATGQICGQAALALVADYSNATVRLGSSREQGVTELRQSFPDTQIECAFFDYYDTDSIAAALVGVDKLFFLTMDCADEQRATTNVIDAMHKVGGIEQVIRLLAYPPGQKLEDVDPALRAINVGAGQHLVSKELLQDSGVPTTFLNVTAYFYPNIAWLSGNAIRNRQKFVLPIPKTMPWIDPRDIGEVVAAIVSGNSTVHIGKEYTLTGPEIFSYSGIADLLSEELGFEVQYEDDPAAFAEEIGEELAGTFVEYYEHDVKDWHGLPLTDDAEVILGKPLRTLRQWIRENANMLGGTR